MTFYHQTQWFFCKLKNHVHQLYTTFKTIPKSKLIIFNHSLNFNVEYLCNHCIKHLIALIIQYYYTKTKAGKSETTA
jgi:hypothetical protein